MRLEAGKITVATFLWGTKYRAEHVNRLQALVARHYDGEHRFVCVTNQPEGLTCETVPDDEDFADAKASGLSCYRRLRLWREDAREVFGERIVCLDIDVVPVGPLAPLWDRPEPIVAYADPYYAVRGQICGSMLMLTAGARPSVWNDFDPATSPAIAAKKYKGSDQAWLSHCLWDVPRWSAADGVYSYKRDIMPRGGKVPGDARLVVFHGSPKPWELAKWKDAA